MLTTLLFSEGSRMSPVHRLVFEPSVRYLVPSDENDRAEDIWCGTVFCHSMLVFVLCAIRVSIFPLVRVESVV